MWVELNRYHTIDNVAIGPHNEGKVMCYQIVLYIGYACSLFCIIITSFFMTILSTEQLLLNVILSATHAISYKMSINEHLSLIEHKVKLALPG